MDTLAARHKFDFRWTVLGAGCVALASVTLLRLSTASAAFTIAVTVGAVMSGSFARQILSATKNAQNFMLMQRRRMIFVAFIAPVVAVLVRSDRVLLMIVAGATLWLVAVSAFLQIGARYLPQKTRFLVYVQYVGDFWIASFLAISGADWLIVAAVLAISAPTAVCAASLRDKRLLPVIILTVAALFLLGMPAIARFFAIYVTAVVALSAWSAHHLLALADHLRQLTASASDVSATH